MRVTLSEIAEITGGTLAGHGMDVHVDTWTFDTRTAVEGSCFVALSAGRDGHDFVAEAFASGAAAALVERPLDVGGPLVVVSDTLEALGRLGAAARRRLDATVIGITGSVGKTATKNFAASAIATNKRTHASPASYNNETGVPLTLLSAPDSVEVIVCEMAARARGDIAYLCELARPSIGAITSIELAHAGPLGGIEGVLAAKGELVEALPRDGVAVLNADLAKVETLAERTRADVLDVGRSSGAQIVYTVEGLDDRLAPRIGLSTPWGSAQVQLGVSGEHQATNAAMAAGVALAAGAEFAGVVAGLANARPEPGRMHLHKLPGAITIIDDAYNANPASTAAGLRALRALRADRRIAVLGQMVELGEHSIAAHEAVGELAAELGIDVVVVVGDEAAGIARGVGTSAVLERVDNPSEAAAFVGELLGSGDAVLVKASRVVGLDRVVDELVEARS